MSNIGPLVTISVPDVNEVMDDYTSIQLEAASSFGGSYSLITTITLVADDTEYSYRYTSGAATTYFRYRFYNSTGPVASNYSEPFAASTAPATTRQELRQRAAKRFDLYGLPPTTFTFPGPSGTTTSAGNVGGTTLVCSQYATSGFVDNGQATASDILSNYSVLLTSGTYTQTERRVISGALNTSSGTITVAPAFDGQVASGVTFELYGGAVQASEWNYYLDLARLDVWYDDEIAITGVASQTEYALPYWIEQDVQIMGFSRRTGDTLAQHRYERGQQFEVFPQTGGGAVLYLANTIAENSVYVLRVKRHPAPFTGSTEAARDTAAIPLAEQLQRVWYLTACMYLAQERADSLIGDTTSLKNWQARLESVRKQVQGANQELGTWRTQRSPRRAPLVAVGGGRW